MIKVIHVFEFFLKSCLNDEVLKYPYMTDTFLRDIGDFVEIDGVGYIIVDYAEEVLV